MDSSGESVGSNEEGEERGMRWQEKRRRATKARARGKPAFGAARKVQSRMKRTDGLSRLSRAISIDVDQGNNKELAVFRCAKRADLEGLQVAVACSPFHVNCTDELGRSALHLVCQHACAAPFVQVLLDSDADPNMQDYRGWTALHIAAKRGNWAVCRALLQKENELREKDSFRRLMGAEREGSDMGGGRYSSVGSSPRRRSPEDTAERQGEDTRKNKERRGIDVNVSNVKGATPLFFAVRHRPNAVASSAETEREYLELLRCFRRIGADFLATTSEGSTLLHFAAISNNTVALSFLLREIEMEVDITDHRNHTPLIAAVSGRALEAIDLLLTFGASVSHVTERGRTAYDLARVAGLVTGRMREAKEFAGMKRTPPWLEKAASGPRASKRSSAVAVLDRFLAESFDALVEVADGFSQAASKNFTVPLRKHVTKEMASRISSLLMRMVISQYGEGATAEDICWGHVFHKRLLQDSTVWSTERILQLTSLFQAYAERQGTKGIPEDPFCMGFLQYLLTHQQDPDNSLLGLQPDPTLVARSGVDLIALYDALEIVADELFGDDDDPEEEFEGDYTGGFPSLQTLPNFGNVVARLEYATDTEEIVRVSKALGCIVRHTGLMQKLWAERENRLKVGDLLITLTKTGNRLTYAYMRFSGRRFGKYNLQVYTIPEELMTFNAHITMVLPLSKSLRVMLGELQSMVKMVDDPVDRFCRKMLALMRSKHTQVLEEKGLDMALLHSAGAMSFKLTDSAGLPRLKQQLEHLMDNFQEEFQPFFTHMREYSDSMHTVYKTRMEYLDSSYFPARSKDLDILHLPIEYITRKRLACFLTQVETALSRVEDMKKDIAVGEQKRRITDWWLSLIKRRCGEFLSALGFVSDAVPQRYIDEPPKSLEDVRKNLSLLQEVLDAEDTLGRHALVQELCEKIYPKIDDFIASAEFTVADLLGVTQDKFSLNFCNLMYNANSATLGRNVGSYISGLMSDLQYLNEIKYYEEHPKERKDPNIVPISSLVLNYFCRALNEHTTVLELWERTRADPVRDALESIGSLDPTVQRLIRQTSKLQVLPIGRGPGMEEETEEYPVLPTRKPTVVGKSGRSSNTSSGGTGSVSMEEDLSMLLGEAEEEYYAALGLGDDVIVHNVPFPDITVICEEEDSDNGETLEAAVKEETPEQLLTSLAQALEAAALDTGSEKGDSGDEDDNSSAGELSDSVDCAPSPAVDDVDEEDSPAESSAADSLLEGEVENAEDFMHAAAEEASNGSTIQATEIKYDSSSDGGEETTIEVTGVAVEEPAEDAFAETVREDFEEAPASQTLLKSVRTSSRAGTASEPTRAKWRLASRPLSDAAGGPGSQPRPEAKIGSWKAAKAKMG